VKQECECCVTAERDADLNAVGVVAVHYDDAPLVCEQNNGRSERERVPRMMRSGACVTSQPVVLMWRCCSEVQDCRLSESEKSCHGAVMSTRVEKQVTRVRWAVRTRTGCPCAVVLQTKMKCERLRMTCGYLRSVCWNVIECKECTVNELV